MFIVGATLLWGGLVAAILNYFRAAARERRGGNASG
jgi:hypothetical protein